MTDSFLEHAVSASLVDLVDKPLLIHMYDGRKLIGILVTFDQFSTIVLSNCVERHIVGISYCDEPLGLHIIRGDSIVLLASLRSIQMPAINGVTYKQVSLKEILEMEKKEQLTHPKNLQNDYDNYW